MQVSFYTIKGDEKAGWDVYKKSFPSLTVKGGSNISIEVVKVEHYSERHLALNAAMDKAYSERVDFITENSSAATVGPSVVGFMAYEITCDDKVNAVAKTTYDIHTALLTAHELSYTQKIKLVLPRELLHLI